MESEVDIAITDFNTNFSSKRNDVKPQPDPNLNQREPTWNLVIKDMAERSAFGISKYGVPLQSHNGRDPLVDAYQENLDLSVYLKNAIIERAEMIHLLNKRVQVSILNDAELSLQLDRQIVTFLQSIGA